MSTARLIPETWELSGDDAWRTVRSTGRRRLLKDAFQRMRWSDGFSHSRSLAFLVALAAIQGIIALVGLASAVGGSAVSDVIVNAVKGAAPGPVAGVLTAAVTQAQGNGSSHHYLALILGTVGWLVTATTAMGQMERGLNRLYGVEQDRPFLHKYGLALLLWALLSSMALFFGASVAAQLEGVRAQAAAPQDEHKAEASEPDAAAPRSEPTLSLSGDRA
jgi:uncharacterized BrkB/YihY/UPF0761 family membrane protein